MRLRDPVAEAFSCSGVRIGHADFGTPSGPSIDVWGNAPEGATFRAAVFLYSRALW